MPVLHARSAAEFDSIVKSKAGFNQRNAVLVDFTATWCGPCKMISPVFEQLSNRFPSVKFVKVDVDELQDVASACGVRAMPTFQAFVDGVKVEELTGADPQKLQAMAQMLSERASASAGEGHRLGGAGGGGETSSAGLPAPGSDDMRARLAAAAEARLKAMNKQ